MGNARGPEEEFKACYGMFVRESRKALNSSSRTQADKVREEILQKRLELEKAAIENGVNPRRIKSLRELVLDELQRRRESES